MIRFLFISDVVADTGSNLVIDLVPLLRSRWQLDFVLVNGENAHMGKGITTGLAKKFKQAGVDCITSGNHIWEPKKRDVLIDMAGYVLRPVNYPKGNIGLGSTIISTTKADFGIINAQGLAFMYNIDNPFHVIDQELTQMRKKTKIIFIDFHAEASAEKQAIAWHYDGQISAVAGTHTHVQTADERILPKGTGFITDAGMTGPHDSVIGMEVEPAIQRIQLQTPLYYRHAQGNPKLNGIVLQIDENTGHCHSIHRLNGSKSDILALDAKKLFK